MLDKKTIKKIEEDIAIIISGLPPNANNGEKIAAICRKHRLNRDIAKRLI